MAIKFLDRTYAPPRWTDIRAAEIHGVHVDMEHESQYRNSISIDAGLYHVEITGTQVHQILQAAMRSNREFRRIFIDWAESLDKAPEGAI
tara:strand:+ start:625 stop:894 length:270 start_codon:yes stop_codon:yes gene_type:complete